MRGHTVFEPVLLKAIFTKVNLDSKEIAVDLTYKGRKIVTIAFDIHEDTMLIEGSFNDLSHLKKHGVDEAFIVSRIKGEVSSIVEKGTSNPDDFYI